MSKKKSSKKNIGFYVWLTAFIIVLCVFAVSQKKIISNFKSTDFFDKVFGHTPLIIENAPEESLEEFKNDVAPLREIDLNDSSIEEENNLVEEIHEEKLQEPVIAKNNYTKELAQKTEEIKKTEEKIVEQKKTENKPTAQQTQAAPLQTMSIKLYFMTISSTGSVSRKEVIRQMNKSDSPLMDAVRALISGPSAEDEKKGCISLVSEGTRLIAASVRNGTATLNFSGEFEFNQYGIEGLQGQLQQIVYTATAFPTVDNVQILIDGEKKEYLGSEGVWIGTPLSRKNF